MTAVFHLNGLQGHRTDNNFSEQTKLFIAEPVVIILCDGQFKSLIAPSYCEETLPKSIEWTLDLSLVLI